MTEITFAKTWPAQTQTWPERTTAFLSAGAVRLWQTLLTWQRRASERDQLAKMDARALGDMGITRAEAWRECRKRFWST